MSNKNKKNIKDNDDKKKMCEEKELNILIVY